MLSELESWMGHHKFEKIEDFRGKMSQANTADKAAYERVQFMKLYAKIS
jgi:dihydroorotate dehydrogenase (fumarate)